MDACASANAALECTITLLTVDFKGGLILGTLQGQCVGERGDTAVGVLPVKRQAVRTARTYCWINFTHQTAAVVLGFLNSGGTFSSSMGIASR